MVLVHVRETTVSLSPTALEKPSLDPQKLLVLAGNQQGGSLPWGRERFVELSKPRFPSLPPHQKPIHTLTVETNTNDA